MTECHWCGFRTQLTEKQLEADGNTGWVGIPAEGLRFCSRLHRNTFTALDANLRIADALHDIALSLRPNR
jgi:hypothetical protein